jgi:hypothetical protein
VKLLLRGLGEGVMPSVNPNNMLPNMLFLTTRDEGFRPTSKRSSIDKTILITWIKLLNHKLMEGWLY